MPVEYNPLLEAFDGDKRTQDHLRCQRWLEERTPAEEHQPDQEGVEFVQQLNRREKLKQLMRR